MNKNTSILAILFSLTIAIPSAFAQSNNLPLIGNNQGKLNEDKNKVVCSIAAGTLEELKEHFSKHNINLDEALVQSRCGLDSNDLSRPYGLMLHRTVNDGIDMVGIVTHALRHLKNMPLEKRLEMYSVILDGFEDHRTLFEELFVAYRDHEDKRRAIVGTMKRLCKGISVFDLERELSHYLNDPIRGCRNPIIGYKPKP